MSLFHRHEFQKDGRTLWCKCGKIEQLPCNHIWRVHKGEFTLTRKTSKGELNQEEVYVYS